MIPNRGIHAVFAPVWDEVKEVRTQDIFRDVFKTHSTTLLRPEDYVNHSLYLEAKTFLNGLFIVEDKLSMAHSLETRVPFLDNELVDFAVQLPVHLKLLNLKNVVRINENEPDKIRKYFRKNRDGKQILRKVMERIIPEQITRAEKKGFSAPDASWFKGESIDYVRQTLFNRQAMIYNFLERGAVQGLITEHLEGKSNRRLFIWSLLNFEWWLRKFLG